MYLSRTAPAAVTAVLLIAASPALAHSPLAGGGQERLAAGLTAGLLGVFWCLYVLGARRAAPRYWQAGLFHVTTLVCVLTLLGPLDDMAKTGTAAHMTQHMLLMVVIAPLWVLSHPLPQLVAAAGRLSRVLWGPMLTLARHPLVCAWLHAAVIWFWHMPVFYMAAVDNPWWHALEHVCFLATAGLFWWAVLRGTARRAPWMLLALLFTLMHTGFLGAVLSFAGRPLYGEARDLADQQLAGLIMWVPGAIPYLLATAWAGHLWYQRMLRQSTAP
jgi:putative membrane protein